MSHLGASMPAGTQEMPSVKVNCVPNKPADADCVWSKYARFVIWDVDSQTFETPWLRAEGTRIIK